MRIPRFKSGFALELFGNSLEIFQSQRLLLLEAHAFLLLTLQLLEFALQRLQTRIVFERCKIRLDDLLGARQIARGLQPARFRIAS